MKQLNVSEATSIFPNGICWLLRWLDTCKGDNSRSTRHCNTHDALWCAAYNINIYTLYLHSTTWAKGCKRQVGWDKDKGYVKKDKGWVRKDKKWVKESMHEEKLSDTKEKDAWEIDKGYVRQKLHETKDVWNKECTRKKWPDYAADLFNWWSR